MKPAALLFDLDGTLIDSAAAICSAASEAFAQLGAKVHASDIEPHLGAPLPELYHHFVGDGDVARLKQFVARYIEAHDAHPEADPPPLPGVREGLCALQDALGLPTAVATTKPSARAMRQVRAASLHGFFHHVQGTDPGMAPKPAPDVVRSACAQLDRPADEAVLVGDTQRDVDAARAAGAAAVVVAYSDANAARARGWKPDHVVRSLEELLDLICP